MMLSDNFGLMNKLCEENREFRILFEDHVRFEQDLEALYSLNYFTPEVEVKVKEIKILKLRGKDMMDRILSQHGHEA